MNPGGNGGPGGQNSPMKISANFIHFYPPKKPNFSSVWHGPPSRGFFLSTLAPKWAASALTCALNIVFQYQIYTLHIKLSLQHISIQCFRSCHARRIYLQQGLYIYRDNWGSLLYFPFPQCLLSLCEISSKKQECSKYLKTFSSGKQEL